LDHQQQQELLQQRMATEASEDAANRANLARLEAELLETERNVQRRLEHDKNGGEMSDASYADAAARALSRVGANTAASTVATSESDQAAGASKGSSVASSSEPAPMQVEAAAAKAAADYSPDELRQLFENKGGKARRTSKTAEEQDDL
jgi:hypothetical protein